MRSGHLPSGQAVHGGLDVKPNPAPAGGEVTIEGQKNGVVYVFVPGEPGRTKVQLDKNGKATIKVPVGGGKEFVVSTMQPGGMEVTVDVVSSSK